MNLIALVVAPALGIAVLVLLARWLGFNTDPQLASAADARRIAQDALMSFKPGPVALSADARAALVAADDGRVALVTPHGDRWIVRVANGAHVRTDGDTLSVALDEPMFTPVDLRLGSDAAIWAARVAK